jgi:hypothetical protein
MIFNNFVKEDIVQGRINQVSSGIFGTCDCLYISQSTFTTSSIQSRQLTSSALIGTQFDVKNGQYYTDVYDGNTKLFSLTYGDFQGSGSSQYNDPNYSPASDRVLTNETKVIYSQYKNILLSPSDNKFSFASGSVSSYVESEAIFVMNFDSNLIKDQIDPSQFHVNFSGSYGNFTFMDDSSIINKSQNVYNLISGSVINGVATPYKVNDSVVYQGIGLFYPSQGIVVLNGIKLDELVNINGKIKERESYNNSTSTERFSHYRLWTHDMYNSIKLSKKTMAVRTSEFVPSTNYFIRIKNRDFNYTNNPTFVSNGTDSKTKGTIINQELINNPSTYITTIGLYNENNELLAIGKLSKPAVKSFDNELLIRVRLDF